MQPNRTAILKTWALSLCLLSPLAHAAPKAHEVPDNLLIEPGKRIGRVFIGDTPAAVRRRLGKPSRAFNLGAGTSSELWRAGKYKLEVVYKRGRVAQIETTNPAFLTAESLGCDNSMKSWTSLLGNGDVESAYEYPDKSQRYYSDWKPDGLALERASDKSGLLRLLTVIVHREGASVIPDKGGTPTDL